RRARRRREAAERAAATRIAAERAALMRAARRARRDQHRIRVAAWAHRVRALIEQRKGGDQDG
ncbi:hypothetical protein, partial [Amycolatopsis magusensis]|uniref:hypothetical protein n=1 Tax=Amycolatopsis magusensis TaxID=882444 RepID=UPI0024A94F06